MGQTQAAPELDNNHNEPAFFAVVEELPAPTPDEKNEVVAELIRQHNLSSPHAEEVFDHMTAIRQCNHKFTSTHGDTLCKEETRQFVNCCMKKRVDPADVANHFMFGDENDHKKHLCSEEVKANMKCWERETQKNFEAIAERHCQDEIQDFLKCMDQQHNELACTLQHMRVMGCAARKYNETPSFIDAAKLRKSGDE